MDTSIILANYYEMAYKMKKQDVDTPICIGITPEGFIVMDAKRYFKECIEILLELDETCGTNDQILRLWCRNHVDCAAYLAMSLVQYDLISNRVAYRES